MIRIRKPVKVLGWGAGTNTLNQIWSVLGEGKIVGRTAAQEATVLSISLNSPLVGQNETDNSIKLAQPGEGMTANSQHWGEVAMGELKSVAEDGMRIQVEIPYATKIS
jgi:hypothetical protein